MRRMTINGFSAKILDERKFIFFRPTNPRVEPVSVECGPTEKVTAKKVNDLADELGFQIERVTVFHNRYVQYQLAGVMSQRSGQYNTVTKFVKGSDGKWSRGKSEIENGIY